MQTTEKTNKPNILETQNSEIANFSLSRKYIEVETKTSLLITLGDLPNKLARIWISKKFVTLTNKQPDGTYSHINIGIVANWTYGADMDSNLQPTLNDKGEEVKTLHGLVIIEHSDSFNFLEKEITNYEFKLN